MRALVALLLLSLVSTASAQTFQAGPGSGYLGFLGDDGRLKDLKGLGAILQLESPLDEQQVGVSETGEPVYSWDKSLILSAPIVADQDEITAVCALQFSHRMGRSDSFLAVGPVLGVLRSDVLEVLETGEPAVETALYLGGRINLWMGIPVGESSIPVQVGALLAGHLAGIPAEYDRPLLLGFDVSIPRDIIP